MGGLKDSRWASSPHIPTVNSPGNSTNGTTNINGRCKATAYGGLSSNIIYFNDLEKQTTTSISHRGSEGQATVKATTTKESDPSPTPCRLPTTTQKPVQELMRYSKLVRRLKWKLSYLASGYHQATSITPSPHHRAESELMFKLDFYEYYMFLERALVHLLGVYGISVSSSRKKDDTGVHRYHANVLAALDDVTSPLHQTLGRGEPRQLLARAKDLRNRWKYCEEYEADGVGTQSRQDLNLDASFGLRSSRHASRHLRPLTTDPLGTYDLENMLSGIFRAFDEASKEAEEYVRRLEFPIDSQEASSASSSGAFSAGLDTAEMDWRNDNEGKDDENWSFMVDAMDWEAV